MLLPEPLLLFQIVYNLHYFPVDIVVRSTFASSLLWSFHVCVRVEGS